jgi:hypothetical protein
MTIRLHTNTTTKTFEVIRDGIVVFSSKTRQPAAEQYVALGGQLEPVKRGMTVREERRLRGQVSRGGWGQSRSTRRS